LIVKNEFVASESRIEESSCRENFAHWIGILGGPFLWLCQLQVTYMLVPWACANSGHWALHGASAFFLICAAVPGLIAWQSWRDARGNFSDEGESSGDSRRRFMAMLGLLVSALFSLAILAQAIPSFILSPCQD
jgi:hypothetical protein